MRRIRVGRLNVDIDALLASIDLRDILGVERMFCLWHKDVVTPNLVVYDDHAYCFACEKRADSIEMVQKVYDYTFKQAIQFLIRASKSGYKHSRRKLPDLNMETYLQEPFQRLVNSVDGEQWKYLEKRGIAEVTVLQYRLGCTDTEIAIPHIIEGDLWNVKYRILPQYRGEKQPTYRALSGRPLTALWPHDSILLDSEETGVLCLCEGEFDCMLLRQAGLPAASLPHGVNGRLLQWFTTLSRFKEILVLFDQDDAANEAWDRFKNKESKLGITDREAMKSIQFTRICWPLKHGKDITEARGYVIPRLKETYAKKTEST